MTKSNGKDEDEASQSNSDDQEKKKNEVEDQVEKKHSKHKDTVSAQNMKIDEESIEHDEESSYTQSNGKSFRKRRLTMSNKTYQDAVSPASPEPAAHEDNDPVKSSTLSMKKRKAVSAEEEKEKKIKRETSGEGKPLKTKIKRSQQMKLEVQKYCPGSHIHKDQTPLANGDTIVMKYCELTTGHIVAEKLLPFPREFVWTYSCHGIEPIYDDEIEDFEDVPTTVAKINQDRGGVAFPYGNCPKTALFSVYDGHGDGGELVSEYALTEIQKRLKDNPHFDKDTSKAFCETFIAVDESLAHQNQIEPSFSGTTACVVLMRDKNLYIANVGDSRAVVARKIPTKKVQHNDTTFNQSHSSSPSISPIYNYVHQDLSIDQNPDSVGEQERIESLGGFVSPPPEPGLSARVWLDKECTQIGLAMSRSIGDHSVKSIGVIAEPVVTEYEIQPETDEFMIIATDGVWEFLDSNDAVNIVAEYIENGKGAQKGCQALIEAAAAKWYEYEGDYRDDITVLIVKLRDLLR